MQLKSDYGPINVLVLNTDHPPVTPTTLASSSSAAATTTSHSHSRPAHSGSATTDDAGVAMLSQQNSSVVDGMMGISPRLETERRESDQNPPLLTIEDLLQNAIGTSAAMHRH